MLLRFLPYICNDYPETHGWEMREFSDECTMLAWIRDNRESVDCVIFPGDNEIVDVADMLLCPELFG